MSYKLEINTTNMYYDVLLDEVLISDNMSLQKCSRVWEKTERRLTKEDVLPESSGIFYRVALYTDDGMQYLSDYGCSGAGLNSFENVAAFFVRNKS